jgi:hypothetical protein
MILIAMTIECYMILITMIVDVDYDDDDDDGVFTRPKLTSVSLLSLLGPYQECLEGNLSRHISSIS